MDSTIGEKQACPPSTPLFHFYIDVHIEYVLMYNMSNTSSLKRWIEEMWNYGNPNEWITAVACLGC